MLSQNTVLGANTLKAKRRKKIKPRRRNSIATVLHLVMALALLMSPLARAFGDNLCDVAWKTT